MMQKSSGENVGMPGKATLGPVHSVSPMTAACRVWALRAHGIQKDLDAEVEECSELAPSWRSQQQAI